MKIKIFTLGGTIDKIYFDDLSDYKVGEPQVGEIIKMARCSFEYEIQKVVQKDSIHLTKEDRALLNQYIQKDTHKYILVTHGTDTMVETANALKEIKDKVIMFTGSLNPHCFRNSDASFNVGCAIGALQVLAPGIYIAMSGRIFPYDKVRKNRGAGVFEEV